MLCWVTWGGTDPLRIWVKLVWGWLYATLNCLATVWGEPALGQSSLSTFQGPLDTGWEVEAFQGHHEAQLKSYSCPWDNVKIWAWLGQARPRRLDKQTEAGEKPTSGDLQVRYLVVWPQATGKWPARQADGVRDVLPSFHCLGQTWPWESGREGLAEARPSTDRARELSYWKQCHSYDMLRPHGAIRRDESPSEACGSGTLPGTGMELLPGWTGYKMKSI